MRFSSLCYVFISGLCFLDGASQLEENNSNITNDSSNNNNINYDMNNNNQLEVDEKPIHHKHHNHHRSHRRKMPVCVNGRAVDGICVCQLDYVGKHCEKKKMCDTYRRFRNGSCPRCLKGYEGEYCELIVCYNGDKNEQLTECICHDPFSGKHCDELETKKIYSYYNNKVFLMGPLGALSLIPMCLLYVGCEYFAKKRQVKRVGLMMECQNITVENRTLEKLL